jgi:predicted unusual protein kinase regulating ubiquinone biosynthesis (AarF/ABC1/UbiB family)
VLLTPDYRLALIDLGMVGHLAPGAQEQLCRLMLAIANQRSDDAANVVTSLGEKADGFSDVALRSRIGEVIARHTQADADLNVGRAMIELARAGSASGLRLPAELSVLGKTLLNLHDIGRVLDRRFDVNDALRRHATQLTHRRMVDSMAPPRMMSTILELRDFAERLPARLNRVLTALSDNDLRLKVEVIDHGAIIDGLQKVANRIAAGLVLAASIVAAALMMRIDVPFTLFGYPAIAMALLFIALFGGLWLIWTAVARDVRRKQTS